MAAYDQQSFLPDEEEKEAIRVARARGAIAALGYQYRVAEPLVRLLLYLQRYDKDNSGCRARLKTLGKYLGQPAGKDVPRRTVTRYLTYLREAGLVEYERREGLPVNRVVESRVKELAMGTGPIDGEANTRPHRSGATSRQSGATSRRSGATSRQSGAPNKQLNKQLNKPPTSSLGAPVSEGWEGEEEKLLNLGMGAAENAIAKARGRNVAIEEVRGLVAYWESMRPAWAIGALYVQLGRLRPGMTPEAMPWPPKSEEWVREQRKAESGKRQESQAEERAAIEAEHAASEARMQMLEANHGEMLDGLNDEEYRDLVEQVKPGMASLFPHSLRTNQIVRGIVLEKISQKMTELSFRVTQRVER